ncbi:TRAP transporter large permease [Mycobacterium sp. NAZ190054]|uniref:TRAP transporter large permease n=1 Tax=Mycobacterium sp. NAZ190054 TaxID=1747766 RepID=UPI000797E6A3|nr:TRAP transporter large permease [Mycobacterium sp. NAZ190054]KWX56500.1 C4-dicarboxylate ABC transporter permease [Mycobacterium sp. NAZ190054]
MTIALSMTAVMLLLIAIRVPVAFSVLAAGVIGLGMYLTVDEIIGAVGTGAPHSVMEYSMSAVPLFMFMAQLMLLSGLADHMFKAATVLIGRIRGGAGVAAIAAGTAFAAVSGSSTASAATLASTSTTQLIKDGYQPRTAGGLVAVVGTLAAMIPPSIILVFYAITAEISVGDMIIAAVVPGILIAVGLIAALAFTLVANRDAAPPGRASTLKEKGQAVLPALPLVLIFGAVVGSIYTGIATATEAAAVGCLAGFILCAVRRKLTVPGLRHAVSETVKTTAMIFVMMIGAEVFGQFLTLTQVTTQLASWVIGLSLGATVIMLVIGLVYIVLGFFMDQVAIIALTVPVVLPIVTGLGFDPVWFGVYLVLLAEVGLVTPPMGLNAFVVARVAKRPVGEVFRGAVPFIVAMLAMALIFLIWPQIALFAID